MTDDGNPTTDTSASRRDFFRRILARGLDEVQRAGQRFGERASAAIGPADPGKTGRPAPSDAPPGAPQRILRPPGARVGSEFADLCSRCGDCVRACPAQCIELAPSPDGPGGGLPYIVARQSPCVVCDDLACMAACPTGALAPLTAASDIDMGTAVVDHGRCLRRPTEDGAGPVEGVVARGGGAASASGEDCRLCLHDCPLGASAIGLDERGRVEVRSGCVGCGVCERVCPTQPPSIIVRPAGVV